jgi:phage terminase Nu1 subunit (DNA packaging protein)
MGDEVTMRAHANMRGVSKQTISELAKRDIIVRGKKRGNYRLEASVIGYCRHLREQAAGAGAVRMR